MYREMNRLPILFRSLALAAEKMEQAAWTQIVYASSDPKQVERGRQEWKEAEEDMAEWKKIIEEQIKNKETGKQIDPSKLWLNH